MIACARAWKHRADVAYSGGLCHKSYDEVYHSGITRITRCPTVNGVPKAEEQYVQEANSPNRFALWAACGEVESDGGNPTVGLASLTAL